jgi:hypothetical protein
MSEIPYQRLTGSRARSLFAVFFQSRSSLWLGPDHLLCADTTGYSETYKRFYFRDVQIISIQQTMRLRWWSGITGFFALVFLAFLLIGVPKTSPTHWSSGDIAGGIFLSSITGLCALLFLINLFLGPTCKSFLRTAVQIEELPSLCRVRKTRKVLARIRPLIAAAQGGELSGEAVSARMREWAAASAEPSPANGVADEPNVPPRLAS